MKSVSDLELRMSQQRKSQQESSVLRLKQEVTITYHQINLFMDMFQEQMVEQLALFRTSLHPKNNREMVFKAGEGQGRSGSFFFFSYDNRFIIKTMTSQELQLFLAKLP